MTYVILRLVWLEIREGRTIASDEMRKEEEIGDLWRSFFFAFRPSLDHGYDSLAEITLNI